MVEKLGMVVTVPEVESSEVAAATTDSQYLVLEDVLFDELKEMGKVELMYDESLEKLECEISEKMVSLDFI